MRCSKVVSSLSGRTIVGCPVNAEQCSTVECLVQLTGPPSSAEHSCRARQGTLGSSACLAHSSHKDPCRRTGPYRKLWGQSVGAIKGVCLGQSQGSQTLRPRSKPKDTFLVMSNKGFHLPMPGCVSNELLLLVAQSFSIGLRPEYLQMQMSQKVKRDSQIFTTNKIAE